MPRRNPSLRDEIRQRKPFSSPAEEALLGLQRTADVVRRGFADLAEARGISLQQYNVLRILRGAAAAGMPTLEIAERMIEKTPGITRLLDKLEAKQLVRRWRCPGDRRQVLCWITDPGLSLLAELDKPILDTGVKAVAALTPLELKRFIRLLDRIRSGAHGV